MRIVVQRVSEASVMIAGEQKARIGKGLLLLAGFEDDDGAADIDWVSKKITQLRIFDDADKIPNLSVKDVDGDILLVSQFTLHALTKKGNRPSYIRASRPEIAITLYEQLIAQLESEMGQKIRTGTFGADMKVSLVNDGPFTIWIDSKRKE